MAEGEDGNQSAAREVIDRQRLRRVEEAVAAWKGQLVDLGGRNTLLYYKDLKAGTLDLQAAGSSDAAVWRLLSSYQVRLSDVFEDDARPVAAKRARTVRAKAAENFEERGLQTLFLAWGMATWTNQMGTATPAAPVLLRQGSLSARGGAGEDFDLALPGEFEINPTLVHFLKTELKCNVTADQLLELLDQDAGMPDATMVFDHLCKVAGDVPGFAVNERIVLGNFSYAKLPMVNDLDAALLGGELAANDLLAAIAGDTGAVQALRLRHPVVAGDEPDRTPPADEFLVLDADASQSFAINTVVRGGDLVVEGPPGTGKSQTIANLIATLAARGKRTLFVAEKRAAIDAVLERLNGLGLGDLVLDLHDGVSSRKRIAQDLAKALASAGNVALTDHSGTHSRLERRREGLRAWRDAVHRPREPWSISIYEIQSELTELRRSEATVVRLPRDVVTQLGEKSYQAAVVDLDGFVEFGGFSLLSGSSPWRAAFDGRLVTSVDQVQEARDAVAALAQRTLPETRAELLASLMPAGFTARHRALRPPSCWTSWPTWPTPWPSSTLPSTTKQQQRSPTSSLPAGAVPSGGRRLPLATPPTVKGANDWSSWLEAAKTRLRRCMPLPLPQPTRRNAGSASPQGAPPRLCPTRSSPLAGCSPSSATSSGSSRNELGTPISARPVTLSSKRSSLRCSLISPPWSSFPS